MTRDSQVSRVRAAEREVVPAAPPDWQRLSAVEDYTTRVLHSRWWHKRFGPRMPLSWSTHKGSAWHYDRAHVRVGRQHLSRWRLMHVLAHHIAGPEHGPAWTAVYLMLVRRWIGKSAWATLREAFRLHSVRYRKPSSFILKGGQNEEDASSD